VSSPVRVESEGPVAVVTVDSPPVNAIGDAVLDGLAAAAAAVAADEGIHASGSPRCGSG
jgi:3-hydroxyacyl-CoA dehydrogenase